MKPIFQTKIKKKTPCFTVTLNEYKKNTNVLITITLLLSARESWSSAFAIWYFLYLKRYCAPSNIVAIINPLKKNMAAICTAVSLMADRGTTPTSCVIGETVKFFMDPIKKNREKRNIGGCKTLSYISDI